MSAINKLFYSLSDIGIEKLGNFYTNPERYGIILDAKLEYEKLITDLQKAKTNLGEAKSLLKRYTNKDNDITVFLERMIK